MPAGPYIILAEDDPDDQLLLIECFKDVAPEVKLDCFNDGQQVIDHLATAGMVFPALVILDYNMPRFNGLEVLKWLQADSRYQLIPRVIWSTSHIESVVGQCLACGAHDYFKKPTDLAGYTFLAKKMLGIAAFS